MRAAAVVMGGRRMGAVPLALLASAALHVAALIVVVRLSDAPEPPRTVQVLLGLGRNGAGAGCGPAAHVRGGEARANVLAPSPWPSPAPVSRGGSSGGGRWQRIPGGWLTGDRAAADDEDGDRPAYERWLSAIVAAEIERRDAWRACADGAALSATVVVDERGTVVRATLVSFSPNERCDRAVLAVISGLELPPPPLSLRTIAATSGVAVFARRGVVARQQ
jgi:hypothetical protein